jgi:hypothetical protein
MASMKTEKAVFTHEETTRFIMEKINYARLAYPAIKLPLVIPPFSESDIKVILGSLKAKGVITGFTEHIITRNTKIAQKHDGNSYYILKLGNTFENYLNELRKVAPLIIFLTKDSYNSAQRMLMVEGVNIVIADKDTQTTRLLELLFASNLSLKRGVPLKTVMRKINKTGNSVIEDYDVAKRIVQRIHRKIVKNPQTAHLIGVIQVNNDRVFINLKYIATPV